MTNSDQLDLARLCVWYVEARRTRLVDEPAAMGSAVALRVRNTRTNEFKSLLLTCAHLVKSSSAGYGKAGMRSEVLCWRPGWGYTPSTAGGPWPADEGDGIYTAKVWDVWERSTSEDWNDQQCRDVADWVLLEVQEPSFQDLPYFQIAPAGQRARAITIMGYPDGCKLWEKSSVIEPVMSTDFRVDRKEITPGVMRLDGGEGAAPGMSGGAVLNAQLTLIGLYRGQSPTHLSKVALQIQSIQNVLREKGWECVEGAKSVTSVKTWTIAAGLTTFAIAVVLSVLYWLAVPKAHVLTAAEEVPPAFLFDPISASLPPTADTVLIEDTSYYDSSREFQEQKLTEVPSGEELVIAEYEHQGPEAELVVITKGTYWPIGDIRNTRGTPNKIGAVVPSDAMLALRTNQTGTIRFKARGYLRKPTAYMQTKVKVRASLFSPASPGGLSWMDVPLAGCEITAKPMFFEPKNISPAKSDENGESTVVIEHAPDLKQLRVYFQVTKVSDSFSQLQPLLPLKLGVVSVGDVLHFPFHDPAELVVGKVQERELQVIPYSQFDKFNRPQVAKSLSEPTVYAGSSEPSSTVEASVSEKIATLASETGIQPEYVRTALVSWAGALERERPVVEIAKILEPGFDLSQLPDGQRLRELAAKVETAVCLVRPIRSAANTQATVSFGVGFLIAKNSVLCAYTGDLAEGVEVSFANHPLDGNAEFKPVGEVLYQIGNYAILDVPDSPDHVLSLNLERQGRESPRVAVVGYPVKDKRLPEELQSMMADVDHPAKSLMPGTVMPAPEGETSAEGFDYIGHDATTSGGTMGGPIVDLETGLVVGIHCGGRWSKSVKSNFGIEMRELLANTEVKELLESRGVRQRTRVYSMHSQGIAPTGYDAGFLSGLTVELPQGADEFFKVSPPLVYQHFSVVMNLNRGVMSFAAANIDRESLQTIDALQQFHFEPRLPAYEQLGPEFYQDNELDGWHVIAPAWVAWGAADAAKAATENAHTYTNVAPQYNWYHQKAWSQLQRYVLSEMNPSTKRVSVYAGPVAANTDPEFRSRKIPQAYWLVAVTNDPADGTKAKCEAWIVPQLILVDGLPVQKPFNGDVLKAFRVRLDEIERRTNLKFSEVLHQER